MAYLGSTQLSSVANPPIQLVGGMGAGADVRITGGSSVGGIYVSNNFGPGKTTGTPDPGRSFGQQLWMYNTTDMTTGHTVVGYFTDAGQLGMRPGDVVMVVRQGSTLGTSQYLSFNVVASISTAGAATLSTQSYITSS